MAENPTVGTDSGDGESVVERELQSHLGLHSKDGFEDIPMWGRAVMGVLLILATGYALISVPAFSRDERSFNYWYGMGQTSKRYSSQDEAWLVWAKTRDARERRLAMKSDTRTEKTEKPGKAAKKPKREREVRRAVDRKAVF